MDKQLNPAEKESLEQVLKKLQLLSIAFIATCLLLMTIPWIILDGSVEPFQFSFSDPIVPILFGIAVAELFLAPYLPRLIESQFLNTTGAKKGVEQLIFTLHIIGLALRETTAVFGFVLSMVTNDSGWAMLLGALAAVAILFSWPKRRAVKKQFIKLRDRSY